MSARELPVITRVAVLEEKDRQLHEWKRARRIWEHETDDRVEELARSLAVLSTKVAIYAALGAAVGGGIVSLIVYLIFNSLTGNPGPVKP